jgi:hypothetical protein
MGGVRYRRALFPGFSDNAEFAFSCPATMLPSGADSGRELAPEPGREPGADRQEGFELSVPGQVTELRVSAKLMYRKFDQYLLNFLFGEDSGLTAPVTVLSETEATIPVRTQTAGAAETATQ